MTVSLPVQQIHHTGGERGGCLSIKLSGQPGKKLSAQLNGKREIRDWEIKPRKITWTLLVSSTLTDCIQKSYSVSCAIQMFTYILKVNTKYVLWRGILYEKSSTKNTPQEPAFIISSPSLSFYLLLKHLSIIGTYPISSICTPFLVWTFYILHSTRKLKRWVSCPNIISNSFRTFTLNTGC